MIALYGWTVPRWPKHYTQQALEAAASRGHDRRALMRLGKS